jgi:hypothetical protein
MGGEKGARWDGCGGYVWLGGALRDAWWRGEVEVKPGSFAHTCLLAGMCRCTGSVRAAAVSRDPGLVALSRLQLQTRPRSRTA